MGILVVTLAVRFGLYAIFFFFNFISLTYLLPVCFYYRHLIGRNTFAGTQEWGLLYPWMFREQIFFFFFFFACVSLAFLCKIILLLHRPVLVYRGHQPFACDHHLVGTHVLRDMHWTLRFK